MAGPHKYDAALVVRKVACAVAQRALYRCFVGIAKDTDAEVVADQFGDRLNLIGRAD
ncbi:hypothetical protein [Mycobacterium cookii]|uniref:hypothetical protein n=1 Tax=Mycobacterium cookii TaxID=1775 RepID=UPI0013D37CBC|nr:hypothetical protein [Mycobacterium cookii]MCV7332954.1 hypothetical protein [Mycobacterium cookii]